MAIVNRLDEEQKPKPLSLAAMAKPYDNADTGAYVGYRPVAGAAKRTSSVPLSLFPSQAAAGLKPGQIIAQGGLTDQPAPADTGPRLSEMAPAGQVRQLAPLAAMNNEQDRAPAYQPARSGVQTVGPSVGLPTTVNPTAAAPQGAAPLANTVQLLTPGERAQAAALNAPAGAPAYAAPTQQPDINADRGWNHSSDFDFADQAALRFAARKGDTRAVAALAAGLNAPLAAGRDNALAQSRINLDAAQAAQAGAQANDISALTPSRVGLNNAEIGLKGAQGQETLARGAQALATANRTTALLPSEIGKMQAETGETTQRGNLYGAQANAANVDADTKSLLQPGQLQAQTIANRLAGFDVKTKERFDQLGQQMASETNPTKRAALAESMAALIGKPGEYKAVHLPGGTDATGVKSPDRALIYNERTGDYRELNLAGAPPAPPEGQRGTINGVSGVIKNGKFVPDK